MDKETRNLIQRATQRARNLIEVDFRQQLEGTFDIRLDGAIATEAGTHLDAEQRLVRAKLLAAVDHLCSSGLNTAEAVAAFLREAAFTTLNRFVALKMLEARGLVQECISRAEQSSGFKEFTGLAPGLVQLSDRGYRLYIESLFDEIGQEVRVLFDRRDPAGLLWPRRQTLIELLAILNAPELGMIWSQDETIGWVYQYFNSDEDRQRARYDEKEKPKPPQNSYELAVRNQFFTPRYVVEFLTDNTLGRIWYEMRLGKTSLVDRCDYLVRRPVEVFLRADHIEHFDQVHPGVRDALINGDFSQLPDALRWEDLQVLALGINGYDEAPRLGFGECGDLANETLKRFRETGVWDGDAARLWCCLFFEQRRWRHFDEYPQDQYLGELEGLYGRLRDELQKDINELSQEELVRRPVFIRPRKKKDPRDIRILDPACGSGHFLLYTFDLLLTIYEEAWHDDDAPRLEATGRTLSEDHAIIEELRLAVPGLILRHNLHGIDIDPRAAQIAALALWMRSQRAYNDFNIPRSDRPRISKTNIVVAEPMPGEKDLLEEFVSSLDDRLGALVRRVFEKLELAGEAGSLLKIEEEIQTAVREVYSEIGDLFHWVDEEQWLSVEKELLEALSKYAEHSRNGRAYRRRLFAEDAERGLGFIDLCRQRYDVVLMNPPFGDATPEARKVLAEGLSSSGNDVGCAFVALARQLSSHRGTAGILLSTASWFKPSFEKWRKEELLGPDRGLTEAAHLGGGILDGATVSASAFVIGSRHETYLATFFRHIRDQDKQQLLSEGVRRLKDGDRAESLFSVSPRELMQYRRAPLAYWISSQLRRSLASLPPLEGNAAEVRQGMVTADDTRFVRAWWEIPPQEIGLDRRWAPFTKSSEYSPYWDDITWVVDWQKEGAAIRAFSRARPQNIRFFGRPGVTYPARSVLGFNPRAQPPGGAFGHMGSVAFAKAMEADELLGYLASRPVEYVLSFAVGALQGESGLHPNHYEVGLIQDLPSPTLTQDQRATLGRASREAVNASMELLAADETTHQYLGRPGLASITSLATLVDREWRRLVDTVRRARAARDELDRQVQIILQFRPEDVVDMEAEFKTSDSPKNGPWAPGFALRAPEDFHQTEASALVSELLGHAFGRWDVRYASGERQQRIEFDPFASMTAFPLAHLDDSNNLDYRLSFSRQGILADDAGHDTDILDKLHEVAVEIWSEQSVAMLNELASSVAGDRDSLRTWLRRSFFEYHIKRYSKSRRKAPIYWQLATPSASYSVWLYYHRITKDSFYRVLNDYVAPKLRYEERKLTSLMQTVASDPDAGRRKEMAEQDSIVQELRSFREEVARIAPLWNPDLNDGVIINFAPLWRLVPQHRAWQKECKDCWDMLVAGDYDWSHLAMHLWPERVVPKCDKDRSLAIAHDLEEVFWAETPDGKWRHRGDADEEENHLRRELDTIAARLLAYMMRQIQTDGQDHDGDRWWWNIIEGTDLDKILGALLCPDQLAETLDKSPTEASDLAKQFLILWLDSHDNVWREYLTDQKKVLNSARRKSLSNLAKGFADRGAISHLVDLARQLGVRLRCHVEAASDFVRHRPATLPWPEYWDKLMNGDLPHLRFCLAVAPDQLIPLCRRDAESASTLKVQHSFWIQNPRRDWLPRLSPQQEVERHVAWRISPAVKDALDSLVKAPVQNGTTRTGRKSVKRTRN